MDNISVLDDLKFSNNVLKQNAAMADAVFNASIKDVIADNVGEISGDLGANMNEGGWWYGEGDPFSSSTFPTGIGASNPGVDFGSDNFLLYVFDQGSLEFGVTIDGFAVFAGGAGTIDADGLHLEGLSNFVSFSGNEGGEIRTGKIGMVTIDGQTAPSFQLAFEDEPDANSVTNGDAEDGDFTGWSTTTGWTVETDGPYEGTYFFRHNSGTNDPISSSAITGLTAGTIYYLAYASRNVNQVGDVAYVDINWYNSSHSFLSKSRLLGAVSPSWFFTSRTFTAPAGAVEAKISMGHNVTGAVLDYDAIYFGAAGTDQKLSLTDEGFQFDGGPLIMREIDAPSTPATDYDKLFFSKTGFQQYKTPAAWVMTPAAYLDRQIGGSSLSGTVTETDMRSFTTSSYGRSGSFQHALHVHIEYDIHNNGTGAARAVVFKFYFDGTLEFQKSSNVANNVIGHVIIDIWLWAQDDIDGDGTNTTLTCHYEDRISSGGTATNFANSVPSMNLMKSTSRIMEGNKVIKYSLTHPVTSASLISVPRIWTAEYVMTAN